MSGSRPMGCVIQAWHAHEAELLGFLRHHYREGAEDLLQEVFLKALAQGDAFCVLGNRRAWLFQVARNLIVDRLRTTRANVPLPEDLHAETEEAKPVDALSECLPRVLAELSAEDREAITLCDLGGFTQQAYATRLGLSLPAAKSRVQRARTRLRARLIEACHVRFDPAGQVCCFTPRPPPPQE
jgi:RNA polymerase sigma-70 factor (ECF subfamily)